MSADYEELIFSPDGTLSFIFSDDLAAVARAIVQDGRLEIRRASDVEPTPDGRWSAIMRPWAGGADLGVFPTRALALAAEIEHLRMVMLGQRVEPVLDRILADQREARAE